MDHAARNHDCLPRPEIEGAATFDVHEEASLHHVEELVLAIVLVPVELALEDPEAYDAIVDLAERLVPPLLAALVGGRSGVDDLERPILQVGVDRVVHDGVTCSSGCRRPPPSSS